ncbi:efflux RND transporter periplasmic adaptor subunit [Thiorhodococcus mannitoliphagus]|uniref:Efflux RND transporter periplasmic adaptor subunit n=1 Tax=Thiorhodococcus mannitoliphagus TaxID=329406 RepID=A0A6P1DUP6_9GAMM|nr:efflux RND transporter periplasmic adaptor subunit [Thiorhodococcus mannitoliphagus]NEX21479.1 efflux RND transporter periplasmic adaptor subunit [Thiorhodococcus mannitoliphagus]
MLNSKMIAAVPLLLVLAAQTAIGASLETSPVQSQVLPREYKLDGVVEAVNRTTLSAQTQGQVEAIFYDVDDVVEKGTVLVRLKDTEHRARVGQAAADLKSAAARLQQAKDEHERVVGLYRKKNVSESAMDKAKADLASAQAELDAATARLEQAQEQLAYTKIRAPYSGIVTHRHVELGEIASPGSPVMSGISLDELRVIVDVPQSIIPAVRAPDQSKARVRIYLPDDEVVETGEITVFPFADLGSNTFKVRIDLPPKNGDQHQILFPGMLVKTGFVIGEKSALTVPRAAVVHRSEVTGVYVIGPEGRISFRLVRLGKMLPDAYVVLGGLSEGEQVAMDPIAAGVALKAQLEAARADQAEQAHG